MEIRLTNKGFAVVDGAKIVQGGFATRDEAEQVFAKLAPEPTSLQAPHPSEADREQMVALSCRLIAETVLDEAKALAVLFSKSECEAKAAKLPAGIERTLWVTASEFTK